MPANPPPLLLALFLGASVCCPTAAHADAASPPTDDGLYACIETTLGTFTADLEYDKVPLTVANFVTLAEGTRAWIDFETGVVRKAPFYDDVIFHRVISGFMNQTGSRNGEGTDGPGYTFFDEFDTSLRHDSAYILSMANSGPNTNGGQIFITVDATPWLDDLHTVFGSIVQGSEVIDAINAVETGAGDKPVVPVSIISVTIQRVGADAIAFDPLAQELSEALAVSIEMQIEGDAYEVGFTHHPNHEYYLFDSGDLESWSASTLGIYSDPESSDGPEDVSEIAGTDLQHFFRVAAIDYNPAPTTPQVLGQPAAPELTIQLDGAPLIQLFPTDDVEGVGTSIFDNGDEGALSYFWDPGAYRGRLIFGADGVVVIDGNLAFDTPTSGRFIGDALPNYPSNFGSFTANGTFTFTPPTPPDP